MTPSPSGAACRSAAKSARLGMARAVPQLGFVNTLPGIVNVGTQKILPVGAPLPNGDGLYTMTLGQALTIIEAQKPIVADKLNPGGGFNTDVSTVQVSKSGEDFYPRITRSSTASTSTSVCSARSGTTWW